MFCIYPLRLQQQTSLKTEKKDELITKELSWSDFPNFTEGKESYSTRKCAK